jgi:hypothetical protein
MVNFHFFPLKTRAFGKKRDEYSTLVLPSVCGRKPDESSQVLTPQHKRQPRMQRVIQTELLLPKQFKILPI